MSRTNYMNGDPVTLTATGCDGCLLWTINGKLVHEQGCPEAWRDQQRECRECGSKFYPGNTWEVYCDCQGCDR